MNLGPFQPVELIKILLVLFLAGYFTRNWERLRDLREKRSCPAAFGMPRLEHVVPGPVRRRRLAGLLLRPEGSRPGAGDASSSSWRCSPWRADGPDLAIAGLVLMVASVAVGYRLGQPHTVVDRIDMWLAPWDNDVHGGDQLAHGLWAFSTGGPYGSGPGLGRSADDPGGQHRPRAAGHRRRVGLPRRSRGLRCFSAFWSARALRAAMRAETHFGFFLGLGLAQPDRL